MRKILLLVMLICTSILASSQTRVITGTVTDPSGAVVPGASVNVRGSNTGTSADAQGQFRINVKTGDVLVVTATNFGTQEVTVGAGNSINVSVSRLSAVIEEVVVTSAFNIKRTKRSTTNNAQVVGGEQLNTIRQTNINNALAGKVSGLQVRSQSSAALGRNTQVRLRGASGLGTGEDVIYVVDGTILPNADDVNLDEVEDITVLQGPAASALFGSQGANGAIVITMKKGTKTSGYGVDVNIGAQFENVYILPNYQNSYAGGGVSNLIKYNWKAGDPNDWKALDGKYYHDYSDDASWGPRMVGQEYIPWYSWYGGHPYSYTTSKLVPQKNNAKQYFNTGVTTNNSISFSKNTDVSSFRMSYSNVGIKGLVPTTGLQRNILNLRGSLNVTSKLTASVNVNYVNQKVNGDIDDEYSNQTTGSFNQWFHRDLDMGIMKELRDLRTPAGIYASWNHSNPNTYNAASPRNFYAANYWYNFYTWYDLTSVKTNRDRLFGDVALNYKITNDLSVRATYRKQQNTTWDEEKFSSELNNSGLQTQGNEPRARGYYSSFQSYSNRENLEFLATYSKAFNDFQVNINAGSDFFNSTSKSNGGNTNQGLSVPNFFSLNNSINAATLSNVRVQEKYRAVFGMADVGYKNFLFVNATLRNDWYSTLPPANNNVLSKSFGASFVFSDLMKNISWLSFGKLRASWGEVPKALGTTTTSFGAYRYPGFTYGVGQNQYGSGNILMSTPDQLVDSAIHGAVTSQKEIGLEARFLKSRVGFAVTYWDGTERDIPQSLTITPTSGYSSILTNAGEMSKKGIDLQLTGRPFSLPNFSWDISATYSKLIEQKVVSLGAGITRTLSLQNTYSASTPILVHAVGREWGEIYGPGILRKDGKPVLTAAGLYQTDPNVFFGNVLPKHTGGLQNSFTIMRDFTVNANFDYQVGGKFFSLSDMWGSYSGLTARTASVNDKGESVRTAVPDGGGVRVEGVDATGKDVVHYVPAQTYYQQSYNTKVFDEYIYDLTFVKMRELSIGYSIPVKKIGFARFARSATFSLVARNPVLIYATTKDFDPSEVSRISGEAGQLPGTRGLGFNLKVGF
ncbi:SusC/RagA family TonB-linked outer membrane protein [Segetibacter sp.]|jgi:TonB-linked SusC/RagA family outer membrane protein|uniref:SusC/RagA family TonB-linked outer membrane protein n=1 Tax=Segetibacter sp. TaxID=2231182 RepID=UPI002637BC6E|nr:SusC/RagA family TonB-linked outer membrane protein [Segetibacter sp.]MCW3080817.1 SusC/RagA family TonB-linked outer membrane protein [Segetibacter sp.]